MQFWGKMLSKWENTAWVAKKTRIYAYLENITYLQRRTYRDDKLVPTKLRQRCWEGLPDYVNWGNSMFGC
jgi:hypothetical protein